MNLRWISLLRAIAVLAILGTPAAAGAAPSPLRHSTEYGIPTSGREPYGIPASWQPGRGLRLGTLGTPRQRPTRMANCADTSVGLTPLTDLGTGMYHEYQGGLYPNGSNLPPADYRQQGLAHAQKVQPLNANGQSDPNGKIVLLSVGMSNAFYEFQEFQQEEKADPQKNPAVALVNGAKPAQTAEVIKDANYPYWRYVQRQLSQGGVTPAQVQVAWIKEAINYNRNPEVPFPQDAKDLQTDLADIVTILQDTFPHLQIIYLSSRIYGGYASTSLNPEPVAYDSGFAVKWLIQDRIDGQTSGAAWLAWGPYLWADGTHARSDGLVWNCQDLRQTDGTHPSKTSGVQKVARMLTSFLKSDSTAVSWYVKK